jgi:hypothetical protein
MGMVMNQHDPHKSIEFIWENAPAYAKAKGIQAQLEAYKSSLKSILMKKSGETSIGAQEREAYAHIDYQTHCDAIGAATEQVELLKWRMTSAQMRFEAWKVEQYSNKQIDKLVK